MLRSKVYFAGLLIAATTSYGAAFAQDTQKDLNTCLLYMVERLGREQKIASPRRLLASCACFANRKALGLSNKDCPKWTTVTVQQMSKQFAGDW